MPDQIDAKPEDITAPAKQPPPPTSQGSVPAAPPPNGQALKECFESIVPEYALLFFDHLYSEYLALVDSEEKEKFKPLLGAIQDKRLHCKLTWSDIYTFDLALLHVRPTENLIRKAYDARARYRNIAGQKEYDEYLASKPPDLAAVPLEPEERLRADIGYLLNKFYLYYAVLPVHERLRDWLTKWAVIVTGAVVFVIGLAITINVAGAFDVSETGLLRKFNPYSVVLVTVLTVALAGIVGGCVSMLQRIQSAPAEGDALFNMAALTNGRWSIILSPLYGGIFASLLFVLFAAGVLQGSIFPKIHTPGTAGAPQVSPSPSPSPKASPSPIASPSPATTATPETATPLPTSSTSAGEAVANTEAVSPTTTPTPSISKETGVLQIKDFLKETGPEDGLAYSLLIIWSFIAGFLERLVPDTLNRLVAKNEAIQGSSS